MKTITSAQNKRYKDWKKLLTKKGREHQSSYLLEGPHLIQEALDKKDVLQSLIIDEDASGGQLPSFEGETFVLPHALFAELAQTETPQGVLAVCSIKRQTFEPCKGNFLLLDGVQDPGNLGTIIRTADAFGLDGIFFGKGTADLYNQKVLRSAQGSHLHIPVYHADLHHIIRCMNEKDVPVYGTSLAGNPLQAGSEQPDNFALIIGNEGAGVDPLLNEAADHQVKIEMWGQAESMNAAVAAGILMYTLRKAPLAL